MTIKLLHFTNASAISAFDKDNHYGWIIYDQKTHKYRAEGDYKTLVTENNTYSDKAVLELFNYLVESRK